MAATILIKRWTGSAGSPTKTDITSGSTRCNAADDPSNGTTDPIVVPTSGTNYSYWVALRLNWSAGSANLVNNLKCYSDGANGLGTGVTCKVNTATSYIQATGSTGTGTQLTTGNYATLAGAPSDIFGYTSGSPLSISGNATVSGDFGDFVVLQVEVGTTAGPGTTSTELLTFQYDQN